MYRDSNLLLIELFTLLPWTILTFRFGYTVSESSKYLVKIHSITFFTKIAFHELLFINPVIHDNASRNGNIHAEISRKLNNITALVQNLFRYSCVFCSK